MSDDRTALGRKLAKEIAGVDLPGGLVTMEEMREFVLQFAVYQGFPKSTVMEAALSEVEAEMAASNSQ